MFLSFIYVCNGSLDAVLFVLFNIVRLYICIWIKFWRNLCFVFVSSLNLLFKLWKTNFFQSFFLILSGSYAKNCNIYSIM